MYQCGMINHETAGTAADLLLTTPDDRDLHS
jgi:hypothetical protein